MTSSAVSWVSRVDKLRRKVITLSDGVGTGAVGTVAIATVTEQVLITYMSVFCTTSLTGATATVELGVAGNTAGLIAQTTGTDIDANDWWQDASPEVKISGSIVNQNVAGDIILTVGTAAVTAGVLEFVFFWRPIQTGANLS